MNRSISSDGCGVCLAPGDSVNHLDHLAVVAYIMDVPMITDEEKILITLQKYYPQVKPLYIPEQERIIEFFALHFDFLFVSSANYRKDLSPLFQILFRKEMVFWFCPHGNSDKPLHQFESQHLALIYGDQMEDRLKEAAIFPKIEGIVRTGNYRFSFYKKYEPFYDALVEQDIFSKFAKNQPTILYAPTWEDLENSSSLFALSIPLLEQLPREYNLIIKLHPWVEHHQPGFVHLLQQKYGNRENVAIPSLYPLVLPLLKRADLYIGDFSSIGYDFLYYERPMFFFDTEKRINSRKEGATLHQCGTFIPPEEYGSIYSFIEKSREKEKTRSSIKRALYEYAFGKEKPFDLIKKEIHMHTKGLLLAQKTSRGKEGNTTEGMQL